MVVEAVDSLRLGFGFTQGWEEHAGENPDNRDHHEEFDQGKPLMSASAASTQIVCIQLHVFLVPKRLRGTLRDDIIRCLI